MPLFGKKKKKQEEEQMRRQMPPSLSIPHNNNDIMSAFFPPTEERTDMSEVIDKMTIKDKDTNLLGKLSDLNGSQILAISILRTAAATYKIDTLDDILNEYLSLLISKKRWGRKEIIDLFGKGQPQFNPYGMGMGGNPTDGGKAMKQYKG